MPVWPGPSGAGSTLAQAEAALAAAIDPNRNFATTRAFRLSGALTAQRISAILAGLSTAVEVLPVGLSPFAASRLAGGAALSNELSDFVCAPWTAVTTRCAVIPLAVDEHLIVICGGPGSTDHATLAGLGARLRAALGGDPAGVGRPGLPGAASTALGTGADVEADWRYWQETLSGELPQLDLTGAGLGSHAAVDSVAGRSVRGRAAPERADRWRALAQDLGVDGSTLAIAAVALVLRRYLGGTDLLFSLPVAGAELGAERVVPLRLDLGHGLDLAGLVAHVQARLGEAVRHSGIGPAELVRRLNPVRVGLRTPLDQIQLVVDRLVLGAAGDQFALAVGMGEAAMARCADGVELSSVPLAVAVVPGELKISVLSGASEPVVSVGYPGHGSRRLAAAICRDLGVTLDDLCAGRDPANTLLLPSAVRKRWPAPARAHPGVVGHEPFPMSAVADTISARFDHISRRHWDRPALISDDETWSYGELAQVAGGYANAMVARGVRPGDRVGIKLAMGAHAVAAFFGALAAGAAYVPLDPTYPPELLAQMCQRAELRLVVTDEPGDDPQALGRAEIVAAPYLPVPLSPDEPAYLLFTSGSTGGPKAVVQSHRGTLAGIANHINNFRVSPLDRISGLASFSHDMAISDLYGALLCGACFVPIDVRRYGLAFAVERLRSSAVTIYHSTPTLFRYLMESIGAAGGAPSVRAVLLGGEEAVPSDLELARRNLAAGCAVVNGYGSTEATFSVQNHVPSGAVAPTGALPIGYPLAGYRIELIDQEGAPTALLGEIVVHSRYVAGGYWRDEALTLQRFGRDVTAPADERWYRTGDLARRLPDGRLVYLGRMDRQIKIRGYRVELGDIEARLAVQPGVLRAVATARTTVLGELEIVAYVQPSADTQLDSAQLQLKLSQVLPSFAVPRAVVVCPTLPLTPTGKVDVRSLPAPPQQRTGRAPSTPTEQLIAGLWRRALGLAEISIDHNFFDLGGHSLLLATVHSQLVEALGRDVPLVALFAHPTVSGLAVALDRAGSPVASSVTVELDRVASRLARRKMNQTVAAQPQASLTEIGIDR